MNLSQHLAKHLRNVYFGGNWSSSNLRDQLSDLSWEEATTQTGNLNSILKLTYHITYYVREVSKVLQGGPLEARDKYSFDHPEIRSREEWERFRERLWQEAETFASLIDQLPESRMWEDFSEAKYGNYFSNLLGIIEHLHYHLGQIAIIKKLLRNETRPA